MNKIKKMLNLFSKTNRRLVTALMAIVLILQIFLFFPHPTTSADTMLTLVSPLQNYTYNATSSIKIDWLAPSGTVSKYIVGVRLLKQTEEESVLVVNNITVSSSKTEYTIP